MSSGRRRRTRGRLAVLVVSSLVSGSGLVMSAPAAEAATVQVRLRAAVRNLPVASETRAGYERTKFRLWVDADGDCRDTRDEVLDAESLVRASGCDIQVGKWRSYYDGVVTRDSSAFDIDHLVPLAEAWDSGARHWNADTRQRFANDLGDSRSLVAVSATSNRSKSDRDPAEWLPRYGKCRYVRQWVAVKIRWRLKVDGAEKRALATRAARCDNTVLTVRRAAIGVASASGGTTGTSSGLDPRFSYCYQATAAGYGPYAQGRDPEYDWYTDGDSDGLVCE
jgi:hypothetical protein